MLKEVNLLELGCERKWREGERERTAMWNKDKTVMTIKSDDARGERGEKDDGSTEDEARRVIKGRKGAREGKSNRNK